MISVFPARFLHGFLCHSDGLLWDRITGPSYFRQPGWLCGRCGGRKMTAILSAITGARRILRAGSLGSINTGAYEGSREGKRCR